MNRKSMTVAELVQFLQARCDPHDTVQSLDGNLYIHSDRLNDAILYLHAPVRAALWIARDLISRLETLPDKED